MTNTNVYLILDKKRYSSLCLDSVAIFMAPKVVYKIIDERFFSSQPYLLQYIIQCWRFHQFYNYGKPGLSGNAEFNFNWYVCIHNRFIALRKLPNISLNRNKLNSKFLFLFRIQFSPQIKLLMYCNASFLESHVIILNMKYPYPRLSPTTMLPSSESALSVTEEGANAASDRIRPEVLTCPWIRETVYANTFQIRHKQLNTPNQSLALGPPDLLNWGRYYGERSSKFALNEFGSSSLRDGQNKEADGYVGYYHHCNGIDYFEGVKSIERYVASSIGLVWSDGEYYRSPQCLISSAGTSHDKPMLLTLCAYNIFSRAELRARFHIVVPKGANPIFKAGKAPKLSTPMQVSSQCSITYLAEHRTIDYTNTTINQIEPSFWAELAALSLIRVITSSDDPSMQLCGTVNLPDLVIHLRKLTQSVENLVRLLPRGHMAGTRDNYGSVTLSGQGTGLLLKLTTYRNHLVDTLLRVVSLDLSGSAADAAMSLILDLYEHDFDYVVCQLLKTQHTRNNTHKFLALLHDFFIFEDQLCQAALLLTEQCRYLIGQESITQAKYIAARAVTILPMDFDSWYHLALCYVLERDFLRALDTINSLCVVSYARSPNPFEVNGTMDTFAARWSENAADGKFIDLRTFERFFPPPLTPQGTEVASMQQIWHKIFQYEPHLRRPISGVFHTSPLDNSTPKEASSVSYEVQEVMGPNSIKLRTAAKCTRHNRASVLDYEYRSTWGRVYDLVTMIVALIGWQNLEETRLKAFEEEHYEEANYVVSLHNHDGKNSLKEFFVKKPISLWLLQLLDVVYDDMAALRSLDSSEHRSALSWEMIGFVSWGCKFNLRDTMSALITSASSATDGQFDYFATVKLLEIYNEFVLSDVMSSGMDSYRNTCRATNYTNKLIVKYFTPQVYDEYVRLLVAGHFSLENVLLYIVKLTSYTVRWYGYLPPSIVYETLSRLCVKYEPAVVRETLRILFEKLRRGKQKLNGAFTLREMFAPPKKDEQLIYEFEDSDTVPMYMDTLLNWILAHDQSHGQA